MVYKLSFRDEQGDSADHILWQVDTDDREASEVLDEKARAMYKDWRMRNSRSKDLRLFRFFQRANGSLRFPGKLVAANEG